MVHISLKAIARPFAALGIYAITVWVDPCGFDGPANFEVAKWAFSHGAPSFRRSRLGKKVEADWGTYASVSPIPWTLKALGLSTKPEAALAWLSGEQAEKSAIHVRLVVSGSASEAVIDGFCRAQAVPPYEVLVFCSYVDKWRSRWKAFPRIHITNDTDEVKEFFRFRVYDATADKALTPQERVMPRKGRDLFLLLEVRRRRHCVRRRRQPESPQGRVPTR